MKNYVSTLLFFSIFLQGCGSTPTKETSMTEEHPKCKSLRAEYMNYWNQYKSPNGPSSAGIKMMEIDEVHRNLRCNQDLLNNDFFNTNSRSQKINTGKTSTHTPYQKNTGVADIPTLPTDIFLIR